MFNEGITELIPFVILEAHPDYKRPYVIPFYGMVEESKLKDTLLEKLVDFVHDRIDMDNLSEVEDVDKFWKEFYSDYYMDNPPWEATAIINGEWKDVHPSNDDLFVSLIKEKNKNSIYISSETDNNLEIDNTSETSDSNETVESIIINEINNEKLIMEELIMEELIMEELIMEELDFEIHLKN